MGFVVRRNLLDLVQLGGACEDETGAHPGIATLGNVRGQHPLLAVREPYDVSGRLSHSVSFLLSVQVVHPRSPSSHATRWVISGSTTSGRISAGAAAASSRVAFPVSTRIEVMPAFTPMAMSVAS